MSVFLRCGVRAKFGNGEESDDITLDEDSKPDSFLEYLKKQRRLRLKRFPEYSNEVFDSDDFKKTFSCFSNGGEILGSSKQSNGISMSCGNDDENWRNYPLSIKWSPSNPGRHNLGVGIVSFPGSEETMFIKVTRADPDPVIELSIVDLDSVVKVYDAFIISCDQFNDPFRLRSSCYAVIMERADSDFMSWLLSLSLRFDKDFLSKVVMATKLSIMKAQLDMASKNQKKYINSLDLKADNFGVRVPGKTSIEGSEITFDIKLFDQSLKTYHVSDNSANLLHTFFTSVYTDDREKRGFAEDLKVSLKYPFFDALYIRWEDGDYTDDLWKYALYARIYHDSKRSVFACSDFLARGIDSMYASFVNGNDAESVFEVAPKKAEFVHTVLDVVKKLKKESLVKQKEKTPHGFTPHENELAITLEATDDWQFDPMDVYKKLTTLYAAHGIVII